jgi:hypothetical protein
MKDPFSLIKAGVFVLALAAFLFLAKANAQSVECAKENAVCAAIYPSWVKYGDPVGNRWTPERQVLASIKCDNATWGDPAPSKPKVCQIRFQQSLDLRVSWDHSVANTDETPLVDRTGYRVELAASEAGPWIRAATVGTNFSTIKVAYGKSCIRVVTLTATAESAPSASVCVTKLPPPPVPKAPGNVGAQFTGSTLAIGRTIELPASSRRMWTRSLGANLTVGG